jgi:hypothetical protein
MEVSKYAKSKWKAPLGWAKTRKEVLERDHYQCRACLSKVGKGGRRANVHHLLGRGLGLDRPMDLVTLCASCHEVVTLLSRACKSLIQSETTPLGLYRVVAFAQTYLRYRKSGYLTH